MRLILCLALCLVGLTAAEDAGGERLVIRKPTGPATVARTPVTNTRIRELFDAWKASAGLTSRVLRGRNVVIELVGGATMTAPEKGLELADLAMRGLDQWTGDQGLFSGAVEDDERHWLVYMPDEGVFDRFLDHLYANGVGRPRGEDLARSLKTVNFLRFRVTTATKADRTNPHQFIYSAVCSAIDTYYVEYSPEELRKEGAAQAPAWIREGINAEMQRLLTPDKAIRCTTISYEMSDPQGVTVNWAADVRQYIQGANGKYKGKLLPANQVMILTLTKLDPIQYRQLWSWCGYVRAQSGTVKGEQNRFFQVIRSTAAGETSGTAIHRIFGWKDPAMSNAWVQWAMGQK